MTEAKWRLSSATAFVWTLSCNPNYILSGVVVFQSDEKCCTELWRQYAYRSWHSNRHSKHRNFIIDPITILYFSVLSYFNAGSQHSGAIEEETNDLHNSKSDLNISTDADADVERDSEDEGRIEFQCPDCERLCSDLEQ